MEGLVILTPDQVKEIVREEINNALQIKSEQVSIVQRFNLEDAASYVGLPAASFRMHIHKVGGVKLGKRWLFTKAELDRFIESNRRKTREEIRAQL